MEPDYKGSRRMRIAICDDDIRICELFRSIVQRLYPKAVVSLYTDAGRLLREEKLPDILLLDIKMPGISGMEAARRLRENGWKGILIFITGNEEYVFDAFDVKAFHFLVKPIHAKRLEEVVRNAYYRGNQIGAAASFLKDAPLTKEELKELERIQSAWMDRIS